MKRLFTPLLILAVLVVGLRPHVVYAATTPTPLDTLSDSLMHCVESPASSLSFSYTVPSGGQNKMLIVLVAGIDHPSFSALSQNGVSFINNFRQQSGDLLAHQAVYWLPAPTTGTFQANFTALGGGVSACFIVLTAQDVQQSSSLDTGDNHSNGSGASVTTSTTTRSGGDILFSMSEHSNNAHTVSSYGANQTAIAQGTVTGSNWRVGTSWKSAASSPGSESVTTTFSAGTSEDQLMVSFKYLAPSSTFSPYYFEDY